MTEEVAKRVISILSSVGVDAQLGAFEHKEKDTILETVSAVIIPEKDVHKAERHMKKLESEFPELKKRTLLNSPSGQYFFFVVLSSVKHE